MKLQKKIISMIVVLGMVSLPAVAASIKIGFNVPLTGFAAADGKSALNGAQLAVEQINGAGGINGDMLELVIYDDQASPKEAVPIAQKLIEKDGVIAAVSGSYSGSTRAAAGIFQESKVPYIAAYAIHPDITRAGNYVFRTSFVGEVQGRAGAKLVGDIMGFKTAVIVTIKNDFGQSLAAGFKESAEDFGIKVLGEYEYSISDRQFGPIVSKIRADKPDVIYATGYFFTAGPLVSQLRAAGIKTQVIGQEGYDSQNYIKIAGAAAEGTIITTSLDRGSKSTETQGFIEAFEAKTGHKSDMVAASSHTAIKVIAAAIKSAGTSDRAAIRDAIAATNLTASTGKISFNDLGEVLKSVQVQIVKDGNWQHYTVIDDQALLAPPTK